MAGQTGKKSNGSWSASRLGVTSTSILFSFPSDQVLRDYECAFLLRDINYALVNLRPINARQGCLDNGEKKNRLVFVWFSGYSVANECYCARFISQITVQLCSTLPISPSALVTNDEVVFNKTVPRRNPKGRRYEFAAKNRFALERSVIFSTLKCRTRTVEITLQITRADSHSRLSIGNPEIRY